MEWDYNSKSDTLKCDSLTTDAEGKKLNIFTKFYEIEIICVFKWNQKVIFYYFCDFKSSQFKI